MVEFTQTLSVITSFVSQLLTMNFPVFGSFGNFVLVMLLLSLVGFVLRGLWDGDDK